MTENRRRLRRMLSMLNAWADGAQADGRLTRTSTPVATRRGPARRRPMTGRELRVFIDLLRTLGDVRVDH